MNVNLIAFLKKYRTPAKIVILLSIVYVLSFLLIDFYGKKFIIKTVKEQTSRKVDISSFHVNPFTTACSINDMVIYEEDEKTPFLSIKNLTIDALFFSLFSDDLHISEISINGLNVKIIQGTNEINIDDLRESAERILTENGSEKIKYKNIRVDNLVFKEGKIEYRNTLFNGQAGILDINLNVKNNPYDVNEYLLSGNCQSVTGGDIEFSGVFNQSTGVYNNKFIVSEFKIGFLTPFIDKALYAKELNGRMDFKISLGGNIDSLVSEASGVFHLYDFSIEGENDIELTAFDEIELEVDTISAYQGQYHISKIKINKPSMGIYRVRSGNNIIRKFSMDMLTTSNFDSLITLKHPDPDSLIIHYDKLDYIHSAYLKYYNNLYININDVIKQFSFKELRLDSFNVDKGRLEYNDYSSDEPFHLLLAEGMAKMDSFNSNKDDSHLFFDAQMNYSGQLSGTVVFKSLKDRRFYVSHKIKDIKIVDFSPFTEFYIDQPFWDGVINLQAETEIENDYMNSINEVVISHLEVGEKIHGAKNKKIPSKFAVGLMKDVKGEVRLSIPIKGKVGHPETDFIPNVGKVVKDLIVKTAATPVKLISKPFKNNLNNLHEIKFNYLDSVISAKQKKELNAISKLLKKDGVKIQLIHIYNKDWEARQYALFQLKNLYYKQRINSESDLTLIDTLKIVSIGKMDPDFNKFVSDLMQLDGIIYNPEEVALNYLGKEKIYSIVNSLKDAREINTMNYLAMKSGIGKKESRYFITYQDEKETKKYQDRPSFKVVIHTGK
ncbi:DUF748 domain-containing protein [Mangrovivirga sp. M17]|uniref:DUF748 domain-containing protein n=1 Tax=Mangrovivirga halotolerans TaxID=2993936 RepID=A0ABT3RSZ3_9BACT|nr:DUF748 domain-containing protein [Mangrovivirga halotolerans]MCX2744265.1 DUF748 domain-containing protein [Mangrovivirga halotolerans]